MSSDGIPTFIRLVSDKACEEFDGRLLRANAEGTGLREEFAGLLGMLYTVIAFGDLASRDNQNPREVSGIWTSAIEAANIVLTRAEGLRTRFPHVHLEDFVSRAKEIRNRCASICAREA